MSFGGPDLSSAFSDPNTRNRLIRAMMGSDPSAQMDPAPEHRIADDLPGTTVGLENQSQRNRAGRLAAQLSQQTAAPPSNLDRLQSQYDALQPPQQKPLSLGRKIGLGLLTAVGGGAGVAQGLQRRQANQEFEEGRYDRNRQSLLQQIEAERRMQEQQQGEQGRLEQSEGFQERMAGANRAFQAAHEPVQTIESDKGPLYLPRGGSQWSPVTLNGQPVGPKAQPKPDTPEQQFFDSPEEAGKSLKQKVADYAAASQKPERPGAESGTWQVDEDSQGNPILFNSKTGQTRQAPDVHKPGTYAKGQGAAEDAMAFANTYDKQAPTGPGDYALMMKFVEMTKPSSGFRFTMAEKQMIEQSRSWMQSAEGIAYHARTGVWFTPQQRSQMIGTMKTLSDVKNRPKQGQQPSSNARRVIKF